MSGWVAGVLLVVVVACVIRRARQERLDDAPPATATLPARIAHPARRNTRPGLPVDGEPLDADELSEILGLETVLESWHCAEPRYGSRP